MVGQSSFNKVAYEHHFLREHVMSRWDLIQEMDSMT